MTHPDILIPFSLPPAEHAKDLVKMLASECGKDGLAMLLSRHSSKIVQQFEDFLPQLPHETFLQDWLNHHGQPSLLSYYANALKVELNPGYWFIITPVHLHIARNHLILTDYRRLSISEPESLQLFGKAKLLCNEASCELIYGSASTWFLRADAWHEFDTSTPDAACGHNIEIWSPKGANILAWRKLQNEIQMEWFAQPLQEQREMRGAKVINGLWLWGGAQLVNGLKTTTFNQLISSPRFTKLPEQSNLVLIDQLSAASLASDWGTWAELMIELEHSWFQPLCAAIKNQHVRLHFSNSNRLLSIETGGNALRKFWRTPTFNNLIT